MPMMCRGTGISQLSFKVLGVLIQLHKPKQTAQLFPLLGSGRGVVGGAVASNTRDPRFESSHRQ